LVDIEEISAEDRRHSSSRSIMKCILRSVVVGLAMVVLATPVLGLWGEFPNDKPVIAENWPAAIVKGINAHRRVYGAGAYDSGWTFYFAGGSGDVNRFLEQVAEEKVAMLRVVLVPEAGVDEVGSGLASKGVKIEYAWSLHLYLYRDNVRIGRKQEESDADFERRRQEELAKLPEFGAVVRVHCVGAIDAAALKIPLAFDASVGGRLARLAEYHNGRRADLRKDGKPVGGEAPSDAAMAERSGGLFWSPTTKPIGKK
jgi:hypothetical protein